VVLCRCRLWEEKTAMDRSACEHLHPACSAMRSVRLFATGLTVLPTSVVGAAAASPPINLVCDVESTYPSRGFGEPSTKSKGRLRVIIDVDRHTGVYYGPFAIGPDRPGQLEVTDNAYKVTWTGNFTVAGATVVHEEFFVNRYTREFQQSLTLSDGRQFGFVDGTCSLVNGPAF
jgi:hypothetical protein